MAGKARTARNLALLLASLAVLALFLTGGLGPAAGVSRPPSLPAAAVTVSGSWTISSPVSYNNTSISVDGSVTIEDGGSLRLYNVTLILSEPTSLDYGITVDDGGGLFATASTFESATPANPLWMRADPGAHLSIVGGAVLDLGGPTGVTGFDVDAAGASFTGVTFNNYYEALVVSAVDVTVENCSFEETSSTVDTTWVVSTSGTSSGFVMKGSRVVDTSMLGGALSLASASDIENNTFTLDPQGTNPTPILIGYTGDTGRVNASGTKFSYNTVTGSDVVDFYSSDVTISHNRIMNTGGAEYVHDYGVRVETPNPSAGGVWTNNVSIEYNFISNSTSYGIRVEQNISNIVISHNTITNISTDPQAGEYNGVSTYVGIYLIRGVRNAVVSDNYVDGTNDQENSGIDDNGIALESEVDNTVVSDNTVLNWDLAIVVQGDWTDGSGNIGPSLYNTVTGNTLRNTLPVVETADLSEGIDIWDYANYTVVSDNLIEGWTGGPSGVSSYEGAAIHSCGSYGTVADNVVNGATDGIVFGYYFGDGVGNSSDNVVYGNSFNVTGSDIVDDTSSAPWPIVNLINLLTPHATSSGFPTAELKPIRPATGVGFSESSGSFSATLVAPSPITGAAEGFTSSVPWAEPNFSVQIAGDLGTGAVAAQVTSLNSTKVTYSVSPSGTLYHTVSLDVPSEDYSAAYTVHVVAGPDSQTFTVDSSTGPAAFETNWTGTVSVTVSLDSWTAIATNTSTNTTVDLELSVTTPNGDPVPGVLVQVGLDQPSQSTSVTLGPTDGTGGASLSGLPNGTSVANLTLEASGYTLGSYSVVTPQPDLIQLNVVVVPVNSVANSTNTTTYQVKFVEVGLAPGGAWWVAVTGPESVNVTLSGTAITFNLPGGSYHYALGALTGANTTAPGGTFVLPAGTSLLVVNFTFTQPLPSKSPPPTSGTTPAPTSSSLPSWAVALLYLVVAAFEVGLVFGMYRMFRSEARNPSPKPPKAGPRRDRTRRRKR